MFFKVNSYKDQQLVTVDNIRTLLPKLAEVDQALLIAYVQDAEKLKQAQWPIQYQTLQQKYAQKCQSVHSFFEKQYADIENVRTMLKASMDGLSRVAYYAQEIITLLKDFKSQYGRIITDATAQSKELHAVSKMVIGLNNQATDLNTNADKLMDIIHKLEDVSDQINGLSINLAIESARLTGTGVSAGKAFQVIHTQISKLNTNIIQGLKPHKKFTQDIILSIKEFKEIYDVINQKISLTTHNMDVFAKTMIELNTSTDDLIQGMDTLSQNISGALTPYAEIDTKLGLLLTDLSQEMQGSTEGVTITKTTVIQDSTPTLTIVKQQQVISRLDEFKKTRMQWLEHNGKKILYYDFSNLGNNEEELTIQLLQYFQQQYKLRNTPNLLVITNLDNMIDNAKVKTAFNEFRATGKPYIARSAVINAKGGIKFLVKTANAFGSPINILEDIDAAKDWIVR